MPTPLPSPIEASLESFGDAWAFLVIREAFFGAKRYDDFLNRLRIPRARLAERLRRLVDLQIFRRALYQTRPARYEYRLSERGRAIFPIAMAWRDWGDRWCSEGRPPWVRVVHRPCGQELQVGFQRMYGTGPIDPDEVRWPAVTAIHATRHSARWRRYDSILEKNWNDAVMVAISRLGDPWTLLLARHALFGATRFADFADLGIATNTLSARLVHMVRVGILTREEPGPRYRLTASGKGLAGPMLAIRAWAERWLPAPAEGWAVLRDHQGRRLRPLVVCRTCRRALDGREADFIGGP